MLRSPAARATVCRDALAELDEAYHHLMHALSDCNLLADRRAEDTIRDSLASLDKARRLLRRKGKE